jgi:hypothetical protein
MPETSDGPPAPNRKVALLLFLFLFFFAAHQQSLSTLFSLKSLVLFFSLKFMGSVPLTVRGSISFLEDDETLESS